ncbi:MAG: UDP-N-acetylmuramoyl-L-alanyl-D-glutamate--2,6-diaminopimelate ligase [Bacilli bacterium]|nr:UDP-N-acetylmuramoyl-L-alanyl-D-glutamate--2,6-diaminopimelate ligase [Bacilli bacterium]
MYIKDIVNTNKKGKFKSIKLDSRDIEKGDIFIYLGQNNKYIEDAIKRKCRLIITDANYNNKRVIIINNLNSEIINIFNKYYNYPLKNTKLIGITGTDGKTTMASVLSDMLNSSSIGTNGFKLNNKYYELNNTTPRIDILYKCFNEARNNKYIAMEVSSEAYLTNRIGELPFDIGILTDITVDHLDKHKSMENYIKCKMELFKHSKISIINHDSKYFDLVKKNSRNFLSYGFNKRSDLRILSYKLYLDSSLIIFKYKNQKYKIKYKLVGKFNVYNIACSILTLITLGFSIPEIKIRISNIKVVPGRMDLVYNEKYKIVIDYAHTESATKNILKFYKKYGKIITIVGCAGERYKAKRKEIGRLVLNNSKYVIFTSDDPRYEKVEDIIKEMIGKNKKKNYFIIKDRELAIKKGISLCKKNYILLILGKGCDNYMLIEDKKIPFSDYKVVFDNIK